MKNAICALERTILRITLFSLLSISLSHAMEEKDITPTKKGNLKGSGEYATLSKKKSLKEQETAFYTEHTKYALKPIFHVLTTGYAPELDEDLMAGKYGKLKDINVSSESEAHTIMKMRINNFFEDKKSVMFKREKGVKDFVERGAQLGKDSFHQFFVVKAREHGKNEREVLCIQAFYTSMLAVACNSFSLKAAHLAAKANKKYRESIEREISSLNGQIINLNTKHAGEIAARDAAYKSCDKARSRWKKATIIGLPSSFTMGGVVITSAVAYGAYRGGYLNSDKISQDAANVINTAKEFLGNNS